MTVSTLGRLWPSRLLSPRPIGTGTEESKNMGSYLGAVWRCRYFWWSLVKIDLRTRYQRSILGLGWTLVHPLALTTIIWVVFRHFLPAAGGPRTFPIYVLSGLTCWNFLVSVTT